MTQMPASLQGWLFTAYLCMGSIFALTGLRQFFIDPWSDPVVNALWFVLQVAPLLATLPGLLTGSLRSTFMLCLFSLLYFCHGIMVVFEPHLMLLGIGEAVFALGLCASTALMVRRMREARGE